MGKLGCAGSLAGIFRVVMPGVPHHITQRGNNRQDVFSVDDDRRVYLSLLKRQAERHRLRVLGLADSSKENGVTEGI